MPEKRDGKAAESRGHRHHRHRHSLKHRIKRWLKGHMWFPVVLALAAIAAIAGLVFMRQDMARQAGYQIKAGELVDVGAGYREIVCEGKKYRYNNRVTTILYAGVDSDGILSSSVRYTEAPRADSISLVVLDELHRKMTIIALNRDTMTDIRRYTLDGKSRGFFTDHLAYAYTYGDGGKASCENLCEAVSKLLCGIPINGYVVSNRSSIRTIGETIGPVDVVVPNDDLENLGYKAGETVVIDSSNLEAFVRSRDTDVDLSNVGRMERQRAYIDAAMDRIVTLLTESPTTVWETLEGAEDCVQTDITRSRYLDLTKVLKNTSYAPGDYYTPEGEQVVGSDHDEFYPDKDLIMKKVIELFYLE